MQCPAGRGIVVYGLGVRACGGSTGQCQAGQPVDQPALEGQPRAGAAAQRDAVHGGLLRVATPCRVEVNSRSPGLAPTADCDEARSGGDELHGVPTHLVAICVTVYMLGSAGGMLLGGFLAAQPDPARMFAMTTHASQPVHSTT